MATPTILDFYRFAVPRGINIKQKAEWTTSSSANVVITAATGRIYFIQGIEFFIDDPTSLGANTMTVTHSSAIFGGVGSSTITFASAEELVVSWCPGSEKSLADNQFGTLIFDVPVRLNATETLTIAHSGGTGGISVGHIKMGFTGWHIATGVL